VGRLTAAQGQGPDGGLPLRPRNPFKKFIKRNYRRVRRRVRRHGDFVVRRGPGYVEYTGPNAAVVRSERTPEQRTGIYLRGACDLPSLFACVPMFRDDARGTVCLYKAPGRIESGRADVLLQALHGIPREYVEECQRRLQLSPSVFSAELFSPTFTVPGLPEVGTMPKTAVVLSIAPNVIRTLYRHREHGFLVDPGGVWLNNRIDVALSDRTTIEWFDKHFVKAGRLTVDEFSEHFRALVGELRARTGGEVIVTNVLEVEPYQRVHNFQLRAHPEELRRRQFNLALVDISRDLDVHIIDLDRALKRVALDPRVDFAHFGGHSYMAVASAALRVFRELDLV
jgi:hypothetical protein